MKLGKMILIHRVSRSLNHTELAAEIGIDRRRLAKIEKGTDPKTEEFVKIMVWVLS